MTLFNIYLIFNCINLISKPKWVQIFLQRYTWEAKFRFERTRSFRCSSLDGKKNKKQSASVSLWWAHLYILLYCDWSGIVFFITLQVRHDNKDQLEKIKDTVVLIEQKMSSAVTLDTHSSRLASMKATKFSSCTRAVGSSCPVYIMPLADDKWAPTFFLDDHNTRISVWNAEWNEWMWSSHFLAQRWKDAMITCILFLSVRRLQSVISKFTSMLLFYVIRVIFLFLWKTETQWL